MFDKIHNFRRCRAGSCRAALVAALALLTGCASTVTKVDGALTAQPSAVKVRVKDARPDAATLRMEVDTSWGIGKRIDEKAFVQPPLIGFVEALRDVVDPSRVAGGEIDLEVNELDVAMTPNSSRTRGTNVMDSPAVQSQVAMSGGYGIAGALVVQGIINLIEKAKAPNQLTLRVKGKLGDKQIACEQDGLYVGDDQLPTAWGDLLKAAAHSCAEPYRKPG